jgi:hypothetical protein
MEEIINFHNDVMISLTFIMFWIIFESLREYSKSSKIILHRAILTHKYLIYGPLLGMLLMVLPTVMFITTLLVSIIVTGSTCYCCPPEDPLFANFKQIYPDEYASKYIEHYIEHHLPTDHLPVAVQVLINFDLHLSEPKILEIMAKNNVYDVY